MPRAKDTAGRGANAHGYAMRSELSGPFLPKEIGVSRAIFGGRKGARMGNIALEKIALEAGFTLYMVTIIEIYSVKPEARNAPRL